MALNSSTKRAIIDLLLSVLTMIISFFQNRLGSQKSVTSEDGTASSDGTEQQTDSLCLTKAQQRRLQRAARKAQALIPEDTNQEEGI